MIGARARRRRSPRRGDRCDARRAIDRHSHQVRAGRPQHRDLRLSRRRPASGAGAAIGRRRLFTTRWATYLAEAMQAPADRALGPVQWATRATSSGAADVASSSSDRGPPTSPGRTSATRSRRAAFRRWRCLEPAAASTRRRSHPPSAEFPPAAKPIIARQASRQARAIQLRRPLGDDRSDGDLAVIAWGSLTGTTREAIRRAARDGVEASLLAPRPVPHPARAARRCACRQATHPRRRAEPRRAVPPLPEGPLRPAIRGSTARA